MPDASPVAGALQGLCPRCKSKTLFAGWVLFADKCRNCGLDFSTFNVGDGPAAFLILIIGAILVVAALVVDGLYAPPWWVHLIWAPVGIGLTVGYARFILEGMEDLIAPEQHARDRRAA